MSSKDDVSHALSFLFDGHDGDGIKKIEERIQMLPGMEWFDLFSRYVEKNGIGKAPAAWLDQPSVLEAPAAE
jgi:hypothetical protein